jgi:hypothetical protein
MNDGSVIEERQPYMRGGVNEPLTRADIEEKFALNARHGGWDNARVEDALALARGFYTSPVNLKAQRG